MRKIGLHTLEIFRLEAESSPRWGTFSKWSLDGVYFCKGVELPWNNNKVGLSCIPAGNYQAFLEYSPKHKRLVYELKEVPERSECQIHAANFGLLADTDGDGDPEGYQLEGCMSPGEEIAMIGDPKDNFKLKKGVTSSGPTLKKLMAAMGGEKEIRVIIHPEA